MKDNIQNVVIYHSPCLDGSASMAVAKKFLPENTEFIKGNYSDGITLSQFIDKRVYFVDFSFKRKLIKDLCDVAIEVIILDHHISAEINLIGLDKVCTNLKMFYDRAKELNLSGVGITWDYFYPNEEMPIVFKHVQDRDIWTKEMKNTDTITTYLLSIEDDEEEWLKLANDKGISYDDMLATGKAILTVLRSARLKVLNTVQYMEFEGYSNVATFINVPGILFSELAHDVFDNTCKLAINRIHDNRGNRWITSMRSANDGPDVSLIASSNGGGGHKNAAGFSINYVKGEKQNV